MSSSPFVAALEIGTANITAAAAERQPSGRVKIIGVKSLKSSGVAKSRIVQLGNVKNTVKAVIDALQKDASVDVGSVWLAVSGAGVETKRLKGALSTDIRAMTEDDVQTVEASAMESAGLDEASRIPLHYLSQDFILDGQTGIENPVGRTGQQLERRVLCVHYSRAQFRDAEAAADAAHVEVERAAFSACCAAASVLDGQEKQNGVLLVDLGAGSTSFIAYVNGFAVAAESIPVGAELVTSDLAYAFRIAKIEAERLKIENGCAMLRAESSGRRLTIPSSTPGFGPKNISAKAVETVVNARLDEIFRIVRDRLEECGCGMNFFNAGCVLTGGGAAMPRIAELASATLGLNVRIGRPVNADGLELEHNPESKAVIAGLLMLAMEDGPAEKRSGGLFGFFGGIFK